MSPRRIATYLIAFSLIGTLLAGCKDEGPVTGTTDEARPGDASANAQIATSQDIRELIESLFPEPGLENAALTQFGNIERELDKGNVEEARSKAFDLVEFARDKLRAGQLQEPDPSTSAAEGAGDLTDELLAFVGLQAPSVDPRVLSGEVDGVVATASPDQDNTITTEQGFAGTVIEAEDIDEEILVVIERKLLADQGDLPGGDCLPTDDEQAEGCYRFEKSTTDPFLNEVVVGVCPEEFIRNEQGNYEQYQLGKFDPDNPGDGVVALPSRDAPFLDCSGFTVATASSDGLWPLVGNGWNATGGRVLSWLGPDPLWAVDAGFGGATINWSRIGWFRPLDAQLFEGDGQTAFAGFPVDQDPTVEVTPAHTGTPPLQGVDVTFSVGQGGGTVAGGQTSATVPTDSDGLASVPWSLGSAGADSLQAVAGADTVIFTATATPTLISCPVGGGGDRVLNPPETNSLGRAFYIPSQDYTATSLSRVDLWFSADVAGSYTIELTVFRNGFGSQVLGTSASTVSLVADRDSFTQTSFTFNIGGVAQGDSLTFEPVVTSGPADPVFFEVPVPSDPSCPIVETDNSTPTFSTVRRQGVKAVIIN